MTQIFETSWWEYVRDVEGHLTYGPIDSGISSPIMRSLKTGQILTSRELPIGALYVLERPEGAGSNDYPPVGRDGLAIGCVTMGGHVWCIDGRASNCTMKEDRQHRCWVRHGTVGERLTVDKAGLTCAAGAGSFFMGENNEWHGFLRDGKLTP